MARSRILGPDGEPIQMDVMTEEIAAPALTGIRQVWHGSVANGLSPSRLAAVLEQAAQGDAHEYLTLAEEMEERDLHYASVIGTRKLSVVGLDIAVESASDDSEDIKRADAVRELVDQPEFGELVASLMDAVAKSYAVSEMVWDRSGSVWMPRFFERDQRYFTFDRDTNSKLMLLDDAAPVEGVPLPPYKFIVHTPKIRSGVPIRGGLARLAAVAYMCKSWAWRDWMAFADVFGMPMRVGRYGPNATATDIAKLVAAVANLGSDAAAVMPDSTRIEFQEAVSTVGSAEFFEKLATFWDKQVSKAVLGQTMTTDDGASLSQAQVHQEVRSDIMRADAKALSNTLQRYLVRPFIDLNFGPGKYPRVCVVVPEPEDLKALVDALERLVPLGLDVETSVIRDKLGLPEPAKGAKVLTSPKRTAPGELAQAANSEATRPAYVPPDLRELESVLDQIEQGQTLQDAAARMLAPLIAEAQERPEGFANRLASMYPMLDTSALEDALDRLAFAASAWGALNAERR